MIIDKQINRVSVNATLIDSVEVQRPDFMDNELMRRDILLNDSGTTILNWNHWKNTKWKYNLNNGEQELIEIEYQNLPE